MTAEGDRTSCRMSDLFLFSDTTAYDAEVVVFYRPDRPADCRVGEFAERHAAALVLWMFALLMYPLLPAGGARFVAWVESNYG